MIVDIEVEPAGQWARIKGGYGCMGYGAEMCLLQAPVAESVATILSPGSVSYRGRTETVPAASSATTAAFVAGRE